MTMDASNNRDNDIQAALHDGRLKQAQSKMAAMLEIIDNICQKHDLDYWLEGGTLLGAVRHQGFIPWDDDLDISMPRASFEAFLRIAPKEIPNSMFLQTPNSDPGYFSLSVPAKLRDRDSRFIIEDETGNEPYNQGIFIDIFVYDRMPENKFKRKLVKIATNKILRLLTWKYTNIPLGHHANLYKNLSRLFSKRFLETQLEKIITHENNSDSSFLGYGYDCVNRSFTAHDDIYPLKRTPFEGLQARVANKPEAILTQLYGDYMSLPPESERVMKHCRELVPSLSQVEAEVE